MATQGETTAVKVALISMVSAILVALIANADKFREASPVAVPVPTLADVRPAIPLPSVVAPESPPSVPPDRDPSPPPKSKSVNAAPTTAATIRIETPPPVSAAAPAAALAPGDLRTIPAWGQSNDGVGRRFTIANRTPQPMVRLFVAASEAKGYGPDRLGGVALPPGTTLAIDADDGERHCAYDMKAVFADGRELAQAEFNVCAGVNFFWQFGSGG